MTIDEARAEVGRLVTLQSEHEQALAALQAEIRHLEQERGKRALAAVEGGKPGPVEAATAELAKLRVKVETGQAMLTAIAERLAEARQEQRGAVVAEMHKRADKLQAESDELSDKLKALLAEIERINGPGTVALAADRGLVASLKQRGEQMHSAATLFVQRGFACPRDPTTGEGYDAGLW